MTDWYSDVNFSPESTGPWVALKRLKRALQCVVRAPESKVIASSFPADRWAIYFAYSPTGAAFDQHLHSIGALQKDGFRVLAIVATLTGELDLFWRQADALIWKALSGFDLSALRIGLRHIARTSPGADVLWMNDSLFGPLLSLDSVVKRCRWQITGFTLSFAVEPHIQSYSMYFRHVDERLCDSVERVIWPILAIDSHSAVAYVQETRLARVLSTRHEVGVLWMPKNRDMDLCMAKPLELIESGFPFLKRSILGKARLPFNDTEAIKVLRSHGHPVRDRTLFEGFSGEVSRMANPDD